MLHYSSLFKLDDLIMVNSFIGLKKFNNLSFVNDQKWDQEGLPTFEFRFFDRMHLYPKVYIQFLLISVFINKYSKVQIF